MFIGKAGHLYTSSTAATHMLDSNGNVITTPYHPRLIDLYLPIECPPKVQDFFADPYDCSVYHYCNGMAHNYFHFFCILNDCVGGVDKPAYCDAGLYWDKSNIKHLLMNFIFLFRKWLSMAKGCPSLYVAEFYLFHT